MFREMRRFRQQLTSEECERILREQKRGVLAVLGDGGYPYTVPLNYVFDNGCIWFHSALQGHKIESIRACDKGSFCVLEQQERSDDGWSYYWNSVIVFGKLREVTDEAQKTERLRKLGQKYFPSEEMVTSDIAKNGDRCAVIELQIEHMTGKRVHER